MLTPEQIDLKVRAAVYDSVMSRSKPFTARELSHALDLPLAEALRRRRPTGRLYSGAVFPGCAGVPPACPDKSAVRRQLWSDCGDAGKLRRDAF